MSKAFTKESDSGLEDDDLEALVGAQDGGDEGDEDDKPSPLAQAGGKNYITPTGMQRLKDELHELLTGERPRLVETVAWAASNGDRSENADYIYGKRRLREIDRRIRFLQKRLDAAVVVDPASQSGDKVLFGATVTIRIEEVEKTYAIVGIDEADAKAGKVSWVSPIAQAILQSSVGDTALFRSPKGEEEIEILKVEFKPIA